MALNQIFSKIRYSIYVARYGGIKTLLNGVMHQLYSTDVYLGFEKDLTKGDPEIHCGIDYQMHPGTEDEMSSLFQGTFDGNKKTFIELTGRKLLYDLGFQKCYIAREKETNQPCYMVWMVSPNESVAKSPYFTQHFTTLNHDEVLLEGALAFDKFRGKNVSPSVTVNLVKLARSKGYRRVITYILKDNAAVARVCEKAGFRQFNTVIERRFPFYFKRSIIEEIQHAFP